MADINTTAPVSAPVPAPVHPARTTIPIVFHVVDERPAGSPGKNGFCMKEVFGLDGQEYMVVLNSIREIAHACGLDMMKSFTCQNKNIIRKIHEKACDIFPGFRAFAHHDNHQWPVEAFLMVILKSASDTRHAIGVAKTCAKVVAASPNTKVVRKAARQESACRAALAHSAAKRRAAEACVNTELGFLDAVEQVSQDLGEMSFKYDDSPNQEMDQEHDPAPSVLGRTTPSAHEPAMPAPAQVPAPIHAPLRTPSYIPPLAAAPARPPPPIPPAATHPRPRPRPRQAESPLDLAPMSAPPTSMPTHMSAPNLTPTPTPMSAPTPTSPTPMSAPTPVPAPAPTFAPAPTSAPTSTPVGCARVVPALVPIATSTPIRATTSTPNSAAPAPVPFSIHSRMSSILLSIGTPEVDRTLLDPDGSLEELEAVGKGKAIGGRRTKAQATALAPQAEPSTSVQPATKALCRKKVVEVPPTAPAARTRSKHKTAATHVE
ncbi:hypothetical protein FRC10_004336 [Ceratobasidium sp. 414]|nr:hypothetical protein FRC10_004336 [Ceratobasidium sp. 414]